MGLKTRTGVEIAKTGTWHTSTGKWHCTRSQLADAVRAAQSGRFRNPVLKRGHVDPRFSGDTIVAEDGEPALGQLRNLRLADDGDSLVGDMLVPDWLDDELDAAYPSRSVEADLGVETPDGEKFELVVSGLALLGVTKPAIQSLAELPERVAASEYVSAMSIAAGFFDEASHPRGGKGTAAGGKFVAAEKGDGYKGKEKEAENVKAIQVELIRLGLLAPDSGKNGGKDGLFGPKTEAAVKKWQTDHGNTPTGKVSDQLLKTLKLAKKGDHGEAQKLADHPKKTDKKTEKPPVSRGTTVLRHAKLRVKAAADEAAPEGLAVREITADTVVYDDTAGRVWVAPWTDDGDATTIGETAPAVVSYMSLAASAAGMAAHSMHVPLYSSRGWEPEHVAASEGDIELDITPKLREALGIDENADEAAVLAAIEGLKTPAEPSAIIQESVPVEPVAVPAAQNDPSGAVENTPRELVAASAVEALVAAKVAAALAPIQASHAVYETRIGELSGELAARKAKEATDHKTSVLASAQNLGKFTPAERAQWEQSYDEAPAVTERILASMKPGTAVPVAASGYAGDGTETTDEFNAYAAAFNWEVTK